MAFTLAQSKFFGVLDLKYGVWLYGLLMTTMSFYYIFYPELSFHDWLAFIFITCPATALFGLLLVDQEAKFGYAMANWYFSAVAFIFGFVFIIMQTIMLQNMKGTIGNGSIQFRVAESGNPLSPHLVGAEHLSW